MVQAFSFSEEQDTEEWLVDCEAPSAFTAVRQDLFRHKNATVADTEAEAFVGASKVEAVTRARFRLQQSTQHRHRCRDRSRGYSPTPF